MDFIAEIQQPGRAGPPGAAVHALPMSAGRGSVSGGSLDGVKGPQLGEYSWTTLILQHAKGGQGRQALKIYEEMRKQGVEPRPRTFVALLKASSSLQDLRSAMQIHAEVVRNGFEGDLYVSTMLLDAYAKCGSLENARRVFEEMSHRDVVSWNAMILGYAQMHKGDEALHLYGRMQLEGVVRNDRTYVGALKACSSIAEIDARNGGDETAARKRCLETVRTIHADLEKGNILSNVFVGNMLMDAYATCGSLKDARRVFEGMPNRSVVSWNAIILQYAQKENGEEALRLYTRMQQEGVVPNDRTYVGALKACSTIAELGGDGLLVKKECAETVRAIHDAVEKARFGADVFVRNMLLDAYAKCGSLEDARQVFEGMPHQNVVLWNTMIMGYTQMERGEEALELYSRMRQEGIVPDDRTYVSALKACSVIADLAERNGGDGLPVKTKCLETVRAIHTVVGKREFPPNVYVGNMLVEAYVTCGTLEDARQVFEKMPHRNVVSWNALILGYAQMEKGEQALQLYSLMQKEGVVPNDRTYVAALKACSAIAELGDTTGSTRTLVKTQCLETVREIQTEIGKGSFKQDVFVGTMLVDAYAKCGSLENARQVFEEMPHRDVVSWNSMILGYARMNKGEEALQVYREMQQAGVVPNDRTYACALAACGNVAGLEMGKEIHAQILKAGLESDAFLCSSLIDMYAKCSSMVNARQLFEALPTRDVVAWNALIVGYAHQGESEVVFDLFNRMQVEGVQPGPITFLGLLNVCSHAGLVDRGHKYFAAMSRDYGITPTIQHYNCMVDLLGRAGKVQEAMEMVKTMPFEPDSAGWKSVLGACRKWGYVALGKQAFEGAVRLDKSDAAAYVLMSNIYKDANLLEEANKMQEVRKKLQVWKEPGQTCWVDASGNAHVFCSGRLRTP